MKVQLVKDPHEMAALIEVSIQVCCKMTCLVSLQECGTFLNNSLIPRFQWQILFAGRLALQNKITLSETDCWREDCLIFSNNYLEKRGQTLVGRSMHELISYLWKLSGQILWPSLYSVVQHHLLFSIHISDYAGHFVLFRSRIIHSVDSIPIRLLKTTRSQSNYLLTIRLWAQYFYEVIVDEAEGISFFNNFNFFES